MGIIEKATDYFNRNKSKSFEDEIHSRGFEISECFDCENCTWKYPSSVKQEDGVLWQSTNPYGLHLIIPTAKSDWPHNAKESCPFASKVAEWSAKAKFSKLGDSDEIKVSVSSLWCRELEDNEEYRNYTRANVLVLPFFVWFKNVAIETIPQVLGSAITLLINCREHNILPPLDLPEMPDAALEIDYSKAFVFLCSHKTRDRRCGITAPIMKKELEINLRDHDLLRDASDDRKDGVSLVFIDHVGGHKYAANVIIYLRTGKNMWLARCRPQNAKPIIEDCILSNGKVSPEKLRLAQNFKAVSW